MNRKQLTDFGPLRALVEHIYTYGFYTREDYVREGIGGSARFYDEAIRLFRDLFSSDGEETVTASRSGKFKRYHFRRDYFRGQSRSMEALFSLHKISEKAITVTLFCLSYAASPSGASVSEISRALTLRIFEKITFQSSCYLMM